MCYIIVKSNRCQLLGEEPLDGYSIPSGPALIPHAFKICVAPNNHPAEGETWTTE
jgi:hypothetical protein